MKRSTIIENTQMDQNVFETRREVVEIEYTPIYNEDHDSKKESIYRNIGEVKQEIVEEGNGSNHLGNSERSHAPECSLGQKAIFLEPCNLYQQKQEPDEQENAALLVVDMEMQFKEEPFTGKTCKRELSEFLQSQELKTDVDPLAQQDCLEINVYSVKEESTMDNAERNDDHVSIGGENEVNETSHLSYQPELETEKILTDLPSTSKISIKKQFRIHTGRKLYQCPVCEKFCSQNEDLRRHLRIHSGDKPYECPECEKTFNQNQSLKKHLRIHTGDKPFQCPVCKKSFRDNSNLNQHLRIHTGDKPYLCPVCKKSFSNNSNLKNHCRVHTGDKPFQCPVCEKSFSQNEVLKRHLRIHSGDKPYQCPVCEKSFSDNSHLKKHGRVHTGDKPFKCPVCEKSFSQNGVLKRHLRIHNGDKPYQCPVCEKSFSDKSNLTKHFRIHTGDTPY